ncbi:MAG: FAD-dependent oxidoreductase [bacterium]|nr:FAD-dependent oxidoreductase [bacterium]
MDIDIKTAAWKCNVCGYIHRGDSPTGDCPVCGAPHLRFEPYSEAETVSPGQSLPGTVKRNTRWRCLICNYEHEGEEPPEFCPVCNAPAKRFEPLDDAGQEAAQGEEQTGRVLILGAGIAGISTAETIRRFSDNTDICLISKEKYPPYYRLNLTRLLAGEVTEEQLPIHPDSWYDENNISLKTGTPVSSIQPEKKQVTLSDGSTETYDKLVLTAGAHPFIPPIPGASMEGVTALRSLEDARYILREAQKASSVVVIGGGVLGLETAGALAGKTKRITLLENYDWLMPRQLNKTAGLLLKKHVESLGITLEVKASVKELLGDERVAGVKLESGETIDADLVIIATGVRANSYLARSAGLRVNYGVIVDDSMQTSLPDVYAAGDIAEHRGIVYGLWNASQYQGGIAGMTVAGREAEFGGLPRANSIKVLGIDLLSIGKFKADDGSDKVIEAECQGNYLRFVFRDSHLAGAILYGDTSISGAIKKAIENKTDCSTLLKTNPTAADTWNYFLA